MCSIAGYYNFQYNIPENEQEAFFLLDKMNNALAHRGPNAKGKYLSKCCGLAHTRLSIRDISRGDQPMIKKAGQNTVSIVYNGEIYNISELKSNLLSMGCTFCTTSDTEVLLNCFIHYGPDFADKLNGIFAFAIYDEANQCLFLYRDSFGVKPLYYTVTKDNTVVFASELKGILQYPGQSPQIDKDGLCEIFGLGPSKTPGSGVFKGISEVKPGHFIKFCPNGVHDFVYYRITSTPHTEGYKDTVQHVRYLVKDSIERQIVSDVPICTFLSGGIDSSIVSSICAAKLRESDEKLHTFSFDFTDNSIYFKSNSFQPEQDRPYVDMMVKYIDSCHTYLTCNCYDMVDYLYKSVLSRDLPTMADVDSSLLYFCSCVAKEFKVVLTGECADEIFGGYPWFYRDNLMNCDTFPWMKDLSPRLNILSPEVANSLNIEEYVGNLYNTLLSEINLLPTENDSEKRRRIISYINIRMFMQTLLDRMDRTSMANGLEARVPFADRRIVDYVFNIPWEYKYSNGIEKKLLRDALKDYVPHEIMYRKKSPYPKSYNPLYEEILIKQMREVLADPNSPICGLINIDYVYKLLDSPKDYGKPWFGQLMAAPQMIAYLLQVNYWLKEYHISVSI
ncbi:MAG: asparagine synthase (glutamine-hydrolyzing) [Coprococcus sp.]|nr:asparagine synthase (glutamine-hydrolyzing) [Coprococcus sp.]